MRCSAVLCMAVLAFVALLCCGVVSPVAARNHVIRSTWSASSTPAAPGMLHRLNIALTQRSEGVADLKEFVARVSDPQHELYGQYKSGEEIAAMLAPSEADLAHFETVMLEAGAMEVDVVASRDFASVLLPVSAIHHLFVDAHGAKLDLRVHTHRHSKRQLLRVHHGEGEIRARNAHLQKMLHVVGGLQDFFDYPLERRQAQRATNAAHRKHTMATAAHKLAKAKSLTAHEASCVSSAPDFGRLKNSHEDVALSVILYCANGQATTDPVNPCSDFQPEIQSVTIRLVPRAHAPQEIQWQVKELECELTAAGTEVACAIPKLDFVPYSFMQIQAFSTFADGSESPSSNYGSGFSPSPYVTPNTVFSKYSVPLGTRGISPLNSQAVVAFEEQYIDVAGDFRNFASDIGLTFVPPTVVGANDPTQPGGESTLDIQWITGIGQGVASSFLSFTGNGPAKPPGDGAYILDWALYVSNQTTPPLVTSISYGDSEQGFYDKFGSFVYIERMETELAKMAARGLSVLGGSGDAGASNVGEEGNDISNTDPTCTPFRAFYPSSSPYVTSVSSTFLTTNYLPACQRALHLSPAQQTVLPIVCDQVGEVAVGVSQGLFWTTGGGFSNRSDNPQASWQSEVVQAYLATATNLPSEGVWNPAGRGYPDVSTIGHNLLMHISGNISTVDGTSASGPVMAGLVSLINDFRLRNGQPSMGLLNPFLYQSAATMSGAFVDVVVGTNNDGDIQPRCSAYPSTCPEGFSTQQGWNPVTGLGTPNWTVLKNLALQAATAKRTKSN